MIKNGIKFMTDCEWKKVGDIFIKKGLTLNLEIKGKAFAYENTNKFDNVVCTIRVRRYSNGQCYFTHTRRKYPNGDYCQLADIDEITRVIETSNDLSNYLDSF